MEGIFDFDNISTDTLISLSADTSRMMSATTQKDTFTYWYDLHKEIESHIDKRIVNEEPREEF